MEAGFKHKIMVVDDEAHVAKAIGRLLEQEGLSFVLAQSGEKALKIIKMTSAPFSIIIADERMEKIKGTQLLEKAKKISPDTQRYLMTAFSDVHVIINAVNKGAIQHYIRKPWDAGEFKKAVHLGLERFELNLENEKLMQLAKKQNTKLYELNCELMERTKNHNRESRALDKENEKLTKQISALSANTGLIRPAIFQYIKKFVQTDQGIDKEKINFLLHQTVLQLYEQFSDLANRNGFEMPVPKGGDSC